MWHLPVHSVLFHTSCAMFMVCSTEINRPQVIQSCNFCVTRDTLRPFIFSQKDSILTGSDSFHLFSWKYNHEISSVFFVNCQPVSPLTIHTHSTPGVALSAMFICFIIIVDYHQDPGSPPVTEHQDEWHFIHHGFHDDEISRYTLPHIRAVCAEKPW